MRRDWSWTDSDGACIRIFPCDDEDLNPGRVHIRADKVCITPQAMPGLMQALARAALGKPDDSGPAG